MGVTGRIKIGHPGWLLAEGHAGVMEIFTRRVKMSRMKQLALKWESTETLPVGPYASPYAVLEAARLFPHGMYEVPPNDFGQDLIDAGLDEALKMGTGLPFKHLYENKKGKKNEKKNGKKSGKKNH